MRFFLVLSDAVLRKKWKYLRDQFSVEFGKIKPPLSSDPGGESYEPKWPHYRSLFLKDTVKPWALSSNLKSEKRAPIQSHQMTKLLIAYNVVTGVTMTIVVTL